MKYLLILMCLAHSFAWAVPEATDLISAVEAPAIRDLRHKVAQQSEVGGISRISNLSEVAKIQPTLARAIQGDFLFAFKTVSHNFIVVTRTDKTLTFQLFVDSGKSVSTLKRSRAQLSHAVGDFNEQYIKFERLFSRLQADTTVTDHDALSLHQTSEFKMGLGRENMLLSKKITMNDKLISNLAFAQIDRLVSDMGEL